MGAGRRRGDAAGARPAPARAHLASVWWDEGWSVALARMSVAQMAESTAHDVHPPLYYLALQAWRLLAGDGEYALRFLSLWFGVLLVPLAYRLGRAVLSPVAGLLAASARHRQPLQRRLVAGDAHVRGGDGAGSGLHLAGRALLAGGAGLLGLRGRQPGAAVHALPRHRVHHGAGRSVADPAGRRAAARLAPLAGGRRPWWPWGWRRGWPSPWPAPAPGRWPTQSASAGCCTTTGGRAVTGTSAYVESHTALLLAALGRCLVASAAWLGARPVRRGAWRPVLLLAGACCHRWSCS